MPMVTNYNLNVVSDFDDVTNFMPIVLMLILIGVQVIVGDREAPSIVDYPGNNDVVVVKDRISDTVSVNPSVEVVTFAHRIHRLDGNGIEVVILLLNRGVEDIEVRVTSNCIVVIN